MSDEVVQTPFGKFLVNPLDCVGMTTKAGRLWDGAGFLQPIALEYGQLGTQGVTILDVGANIGTFSVWLASRGAWRVVAVEPVAKTMQYLKANLDLNYATCGDVVVPLEIAAYNRPTRMGPVTFDLNNLGATPLGETAEGPIEADQLDNWQHCFGPKVSLIKIDAQGCDGPALLGLEETIERDQPAIVFEWEADLAVAHELTLEEVLAWFRELHYTVRAWPCYPNNFLATPRQ